MLVFCSGVGGASWKVGGAFSLGEGMISVDGLEAVLDALGRLGRGQSLVLAVESSGILAPQRDEGEEAALKAG